MHEYYLKVGAAITIANLIDLLAKHKDMSPNTFEYLASHLRKVCMLIVVIKLLTGVSVAHTTRLQVLLLGM